MFLKCFFCTSDTISVAVSAYRKYRDRNLFVKRRFLFRNTISPCATTSSFFLSASIFHCRHCWNSLLLFRYALYPFTLSYHQCLPLTSTSPPFKPRQPRSDTTGVQMKKRSYVRSSPIRQLLDMKRWALSAALTPCAAFCTIQR